MSAKSCTLCGARAAHVGFFFPHAAFSRLIGQPAGKPSVVSYRLCGGCAGKPDYMKLVEQQILRDSQAQRLT